MKRAAPLAVVCALAVGACGPPPPQAPAAIANRVAESISGIAQACGEQAQLREFPRYGRSRRREAAVLASALLRARELRHAVESNPAWIYQGRTLAEVRGLARQRLRECGLRAAAARL